MQLGNDDYELIKYSGCDQTFNMDNAQRDIIAHSTLPKISWPPSPAQNKTIISTQPSPKFNNFSFHVAQFILTQPSDPLYIYLQTQEKYRH